MYSEEYVVKFWLTPKDSKPKKVHLHIQKYKGIPVVFGVKDVNFAEFDPRNCYEGDGEFHIENYILRVLEINGVRKSTEKLKISASESLKKYGLSPL